MDPNDRFFSKQAYIFGEEVMIVMYIFYLSAQVMIVMLVVTTLGGGHRKSIEGNLPKRPKISGIWEFEEPGSSHFLEAFRAANTQDFPASFRA